MGETFFHPFTLFCRLFCPPRSLLLFLSVPFFSFFIAFFSLSPTFFIRFLPHLFYFPQIPLESLESAVGFLTRVWGQPQPQACFCACRVPKTATWVNILVVYFHPAFGVPCLRLQELVKRRPPPFFWGGGAAFPRAPFSVSTETGREIVMELSRMGVWCVDGERGAGRRIGRGEFRCVPYRCASVPLSSLAICPTGVLVPSPSCRLTIRYSQCRRTRRTSGDFTAKTCSRAYYHLIGTRLSTSSIHYRSQRPTAV